MRYRYNTHRDLRWFYLQYISVEIRTFSNRGIQPHVPERVRALVQAYRPKLLQRLMPFIVAEK